MRVLLTGGTGYIGSRLREHIRKDGHEVRLLVRPGSEDAIGSAEDYEIVTGDVFNTNACLRACDGCDAVVHLIGIIREYPSKAITFDQYHPAATSNLLDAARRSGVPRFLHMSALGARENATSLYHQTKFAAEQLVEQSGLRWTIFRPSLVMGYGDHFTQEVIDLIGKRVVPMIDGGEALFQPVALDDVCAVMARALGMPETQGQIYDLGGPDRVSFKDLVSKIAAQARLEYRSVDVTSWMIKPVVALLDRFASFPITEDQLRMLRDDNVCEIDHYVKAFRIEPKGLERILPTLLGEAPPCRKMAGVL